MDQRIELGKKLAWILFEMGRLQTFIDFTIHTPDTGSRYDYEKFWLKKTEHAYVKTNVSDCKAGTINRDILG